MLNCAKQIVKTLQDKGYQAVFAGGCVRDMLLGIEPKDYDIATSAIPDDIEKLFEHTVAVGKSFGVITVLFNGYSFEVATFRSDGVYTDGRHPDSIHYTNLMEEDARRRDITINGMFYDPINDKIYDYVGGKQDLEDCKIRFIGTPEERILEDNLRMLRVVRFATKLHFGIIPTTMHAIFLHAYKIENVSKERIINEIIKILQTNSPSRGFEILNASRLLLYILHDVGTLKGCKQDPFYHPEGDVWDHTMKLLDSITQISKDPITLLAALLHDIGKPYCTKIENGRITSKKHEYIGAEKSENILRNFNCSNEIVETVSNIIKDHMRIKRVLIMKKSKIIKLICKPYFEKLLLISYYDSLAGSGAVDWYHYLLEKKEEYFKEGTKPKLPECLINGNDLISLGFKPGPIFKIILDRILNLQLEDKILTKELALAYVRSKDWSED